MSDAERMRAVELLDSGLTQQEVAAKFGVAPSSISRLHKAFMETGSVARKRRGGKRTSIPSEDQNEGKIQFK